MTKRILVCGDRNWNDHNMIWAVLDKLPSNTIIVHGAARGADRMANDVAEALGLTVEPHKAQWDLYGRSAGVRRNQEMLDSGIDQVHAFHDDLGHSKGTGDMVRRAKKAGVPVKVHRH